MIKNLRLIGFVLASCVGIIAIFVTIAMGSTYVRSAGQNTLANIIVMLFPVIVFIAVYIFNKFVNKLSITQCGFQFSGIFKNTILGIVLSTLIVFGALLLAQKFFAIDYEFRGLQPEFVKPLLSLISLLFVVGAWEEFYFRGLLFNTFLKGKFNFHISAILSGLIFSAFHWSSFDMTETSIYWYVGIVFMGYFLATLYAYTGSIWSVFGFHFNWNFLVMLMDPADNEVGLYVIPSYEQTSIILDNIMSGILGGVALLCVLIARTEPIKMYMRKVSESD